MMVLGIVFAKIRVELTWLHRCVVRLNGVAYGLEMRIGVLIKAWSLCEIDRHRCDVQLRCGTG